MKVKGGKSKTEGVDYTGLVWNFGLVCLQHMVPASFHSNFKFQILCWFNSPVRFKSFLEIEIMNPRVNILKFPHTCLS